MTRPSLAETKIESAKERIKTELARLQLEYDELSATCSSARSEANVVSARITGLNDALVMLGEDATPAPKKARKPRGPSKKSVEAAKAEMDQRIGLVGMPTVPSRDGAGSSVLLAT